MSKNSVKTILITLYLSAVQDPEPLLLKTDCRNWKTSYVKMIDVWLLFGLILPFLGFILSIFEELVAQAQEDADTGRVKVELQNNL